jgi:hypothetical protein
MTVRPTEGSEEPEVVDPVMLAVLANRGRNATVLSAEQERLLDDWVAGELPPEAAERAAELVRRNSLAAERVLERRLLDAAQQSSPVPQALEARILSRAPAAGSSTLAGWWRSLGRRQWLGVAGVAALACIAALAVAPMLQQTMREGAPVQVALATFADRSALFEPSDTRMRGPGPPPSPADQRFRDVDIPLGVLKALIATAGQPSAAASRDIEAYLPAGAGAGKEPVRVIVDSALRDSVVADGVRDRMAVRIYDLKDPRAADIRNLIAGAPDNAHAWLLTLKP